MPDESDKAKHRRLAQAADYEWSDQLTDWRIEQLPDEYAALDLASAMLRGLIHQTEGVMEL